MAAMRYPFLSPDEYLERENAAGFKSEYVNGELLAMAGASQSHNRVAGNAYFDLRTRLQGKPCEPYGSDMRVKVEETDMYAYPDVSVVCGEQRFERKRGETLLNPTVLIEVLSPSTEAFDRGAKFAHYRRLLSLQAYVLISQTEVRVERFLREGEEWTLREYTCLTNTLRLPSLNLELPLTLLYERVTFPDPEPTG